MDLKMYKVSFKEIVTYARNKEHAIKLYKDYIIKNIDKLKVEVDKVSG